MRWALWSAFSPSQVILGTVLVGTVLWLAGRVRVGRALCISGGLAIAAFGVLPLSHHLVGALEQRFAATALPPRVAGIVLLAGAERPVATERFGEPQLNRHATRYTTAQRLAVRYPDARIVFVGGAFVDSRTGFLDQSGVARMLFASTGVDLARVTFENRSTDTCDSAINARALVQPRPDEAWVLVTSAMHLPRAMGCFRAAGWEVIPQGADRQVVLGEWSETTFRIADNLALLDMALHEWLGLFYYRATGRIGTLFPAP